MGFVSDKIGTITSNIVVDASGLRLASGTVPASNVMTVDASGKITLLDIASGSTAKILGFFGDGSLGDVTISSTTTLVREACYQNLTISGSGILNTAGHIVRVRGTLTVQSGGVLACNGSNGTAGSMFGTTLQLGGNGPYAEGSIGYIGIPGKGGYGGTSTSSTGSQVGGGGSGGVSILSTLGNPPYGLRAGAGGGGGGAIGATITIGANPGGSTWVGQAGGAGGAAVNATGALYASGGSGGGGGGVLLIYTNNINNAGSIEAKGGNGGNGGTSSGNQNGNGGGGGGGTILLFYRNTTGSGVGTLSVAGGAAGTGGNGGAAGGTGLTLSYQV